MTKKLWKNCANGNHIQAIHNGKEKEKPCKDEGGVLCECDCHKTEKPRN